VSKSKRAVWRDDELPPFYYFGPRSQGHKDKYLEEAFVFYTDSGKIFADSQAMYRLFGGNKAIWFTMAALILVDGPNQLALIPIEDVADVLPADPEFTKEMFLDKVNRWARRARQSTERLKKAG
jgi:hypothetical protein